MRRILYISILSVWLVLISCSEKSVETKAETNSVGLSKDSLQDLAGLKKLMAQSIHPILFGCDTLELANVGPPDGAKVTDKELDEIYRPLAEDSAEFSKPFKLANKVVYYASQEKKFSEDRVVVVEIEGRIKSSREIVVVENYNKFPNSGHIEKHFTYANGKWNYFVKDSSWMSPVFEDEGTVSAEIHK